MWAIFTLGVATGVFAWELFQRYREWRADCRERDRLVAERADAQHGASMRDEHPVERITDYYYLCACGQAGSQRWAIMHQFPSSRVA